MSIFTTPYSGVKWPKFYSPNRRQQNFFFLANGAHLPGKTKTQNYSNSSVNFKNWFQTPGDDVCITENALRAVLQKKAVR